MDVAVTGSTGFVGRYLVPRLKSDGFLIREINRLGARGVNEFVSVDPWSEEAWAESLGDAESVVHLIGRAHHTSEGDEALQRYMADNVEVLRALLAGAGRVRRIVYLSSVKAVCESSVNGPITDDTLPEPSTAYGRSKRAAEVLLHQWSQGKNRSAVVLRPPLIYGPGVRGNLRSLMRIADSSMPLPLGRIGNRRSLLSLENLAEAVVASLVDTNVGFETLLVSDPYPVSTGEIVEYLREGMGRKPRVFPVPRWAMNAVLAATGQRSRADRLLGNLEIDPTNARTTLNWNPSVETRDGLLELAADWRRAASP